MNEKSRKTPINYYKSNRIILTTLRKALLRMDLVNISHFWLDCHFGCVIVVGIFRKPLLKFFEFLILIQSEDSEFNAKIYINDHGNIFF